MHGAHHTPGCTAQVPGCRRKGGGQARRRGGPEAASGWQPLLASWRGGKAYTHPPAAAAHSRYDAAAALLHPYISRTNATCVSSHCARASPGVSWRLLERGVRCRRQACCSGVRPDPVPPFPPPSWTGAGENAASSAVRTRTGASKSSQQCCCCSSCASVAITPNLQPKRHAAVKQCQRY